MAICLVLPACFSAFAVLPISLCQCSRGNNTPKNECVQCLEMFRKEQSFYFHHRPGSLKLMRCECLSKKNSRNEGASQRYLWQPDLGHTLKKDPIRVTCTANLHEKHACTLGRGQCLKKEGKRIRSYFTDIRRANDMVFN